MAQLAMPLMLIGTAVSVAGTLSQGKVADQQAKMQARQMREAALVEEANANRLAAEERRQSRLVQSRARAVGAASGAGDYGSLVEDIDAEGEYRALFALHNGQQSATGIRNQADMTLWEGKQAKKASYLNAANTIMSAASQMPISTKYSGGAQPEYGYGGKAKYGVDAPAGSTTRYRNYA